MAYFEELQSVNVVDECCLISALFRISQSLSQHLFWKPNGCGQNLLAGAPHLLAWGVRMALQGVSFEKQRGLLETLGLVQDLRWEEQKDGVRDKGKYWKPVSL